MSNDVTISIDKDINDRLAMGETHVVSAILQHASDALANGGRVIVQREYTNAAPDRLHVFEKQSDLLDWKKRLNDAQIQLGRKEIA